MNTALSAVDEDFYRIETARLLTPALAIYPQVVRQNIRRILDVLGGNADRWRPHLKTVKAADMMKLLVEAGVTTAKCATTLELLAACQSGFQDVLVAFPHTGANAARIVEIAREHPRVRVSVLLESSSQIENWKNSPVGVFIDVNPGMDRTGIQRNRVTEILAHARDLCSAGIDFRGLHFYDGNSTEDNLNERTRAAHLRYDDLMGLIGALQKNGLSVQEVVTSGTPALPCALTYGPLSAGPFQHRVSAGTVVYSDLSSLRQLPDYGLCPAVVVLSRVISHPRQGIITCDAGHKSVSVDSGVPNCAAIGRPDFVPLKPSEEHLPIEIPAHLPFPPLGSVLYLVPRHVCPTVNNATYALLVEGGSVCRIIEVTARGHERPL